MTPDAFLATILDAPADDGPRLVYADWLEERGETARAEFIRVQCELATPDPCGLPETCIHGPAQPPVGLQQTKPSCERPECRARDRLRRRERVPLVAHPANPHWLGKPDPLIDSHPHRYVAAGGPTIVAHGRQVQEIRFTFARGFLDRVDATAADLTRHAAAILAAHPVAEFRSTDTGQRVTVHREPYGWLVIVRRGDDGPASFATTREQMLAGLPGLLRQHLRAREREQRLPGSMFRNAGTQENPDWRPVLMAAPPRPVFRRGRAAVEQAASRAADDTYDNTEPRGPVGAADIDRAIAETANGLPSVSITAEFRAEDVTITPAGAAFFAELLSPDAPVPHPGPLACPTCRGPLVLEREEPLRHTPPHIYDAVERVYRCPACAAARDASP